MKNTIAIRTAAGLSAAAIALLLGACGQTGAADASGPESSAAESSAAAGLTLSDGWVKAVDKDHGMTAVFGQLKNTSGADIHLTGADTSVAGKCELHETVADSTGSMKMQEKDGGFVIPAGKTFDLEPGGNHIMLMELKEGIEPGAEVTVTMHTDAGDVEVTVPAKEYAGAQEEYVQDGGHEGHGEKSEGHDGHGEKSDEGHGDH